MDLSAENYKTPKKEIILYVYGWKIHNIRKMSVLPKLTYSFNTFLVKNPARFFCRYADKIILKYVWKTMSKEKDKFRGITLSVSRLII